jgi:putative transcriptional regulator
VRVEWDPAKDRTNRVKHGLGFDEAAVLFESGADYLVIYDEEHSVDEDRFLAVGPIAKGVVTVAYGAHGGRDPHHQCSHGNADRGRDVLPAGGRPETMSDDIRELTAADFERAIPRRLRDRLMRGQFKSGDDVAALRRFIGLSQDMFARALGISVHTLRNWEQGRRMPEGPALALLRIAARHPRVLRENLALAG